MLKQTLSEENHEIESFSLPLTLEFNFIRNRIMDFDLVKRRWKSVFIPFVRAGGLITYNYSAKYNSQAEASYYGYYSELFEYTFTEGLYDFGEYSINGSGDLNVSRYSYGITTSVGVKYNVNNKWNG